MFGLGKKEQMSRAFLKVLRETIKEINLKPENARNCAEIVQFKLYLFDEEFQKIEDNNLQSHKRRNKPFTPPEGVKYSIRRRSREDLPEVKRENLIRRKIQEFVEDRYRAIEKGAMDGTDVNWAAASLLETAMGSKLARINKSILEKTCDMTDGILDDWIRINITLNRKKEIQNQAKKKFEGFVTCPNCKSYMRVTKNTSLCQFCSASFPTNILKFVFK